MNNDKCVFVFFFRFITGLSFYGLSFNVGNLTGSVYVNNAISGAVELPQVFFLLLSKRMGRKAPTVVSLFIGGVALIASALMNVYVDLSGKFTITVTLYMLVLFFYQCSVDRACIQVTKVKTL